MLEPVKTPPPNKWPKRFPMVLVMGIAPILAPSRGVTFKVFDWHIIFGFSRFCSAQLVA